MHQIEGTQSALLAVAQRNIPSPLEQKLSEHRASIDAGMKAMHENLLGVLAQQNAQHHAAISEVIKAVKAPKRRKAIRGPDGKIAETVETIG